MGEYDDKKFLKVYSANQVKPEKPPPIINKATAGKPGFTATGEPSSPGSVEALRANQAKEQAKVDAGKKAKELQKAQQARIAAAAQKKAEEAEAKAAVDAEKMAAFNAKAQKVAQARADEAAAKAQQNQARFDAKKAATKVSAPIVIKGQK